MDTLKTLLSAAAPSMGGMSGPYGGYGQSNGLIDGMKWVMLGGTVETARRLSSGAWNHFVNSFFLTAHFSEDEPPYDWLMLWLSRRPEWQHSREFETTTRITTPGGFKARGIGEFGDEDAEEGAPSSSIDDNSKPQTRVVFQPTFDTTHTIYWKGHWLRVKRSRRPDRYGYTDNETLSISVVARNNSILKQLVLRAKREYEAEAITRIQIYFADQYGGWRWTDSRHKRPLSSIVLMPGVKEMLVNDTKDFLASEKWYADRGIPFRRGYLLWGVPGSGKSSLIHALAGELGLDIYVVSLSASWVSDATLTTLLGRIPARCILLLEDLDAAFTRSLSRDKKEKKRRRKEKKKAKEEQKNGENKEEGPSPPPRRRNKNGESLSDQNTLTLSGLLNALDGVAASEGRVLFATTNHLTKLDPALSRPGRMDVWVEFRNASRPQSEGLFRNFWPLEDADPSTPIASEEEEKELREAGVNLPEGERVGDFVASDAQPPVEDDAKSSLFTRLSTPISVFSDLLSGGSNVNPSESVAQEQVNPPALKFTSSTSPAVNGGHSRRPSLASLSDDTLASGISGAVHEKLKMDRATLDQLATVFGQSIPEDEFSVAALQGYLLKHKSNAFEAAHGAAAWVIQEKETKAKLEKKKKEREAKKKARKEKAKAKRKAQKEKAKKEKEEADKAAAAAAAVAAAAAPVPVPATPSPPPAVVENAPVAAAAPLDESIVIVPAATTPPPPPADLAPPPPPAPIELPPAPTPATPATNDDSDSDSSDSDSDCDDDGDEDSDSDDSDSDEEEQ